MTDQETETLVKRAREGDGTAVTQLLQLHRQRLKRMVHSRMDDRILGRVDPSDVVQDALATACQQLPQYLAHPPIPFYPWLRRIAWQTLAHLHEQHLDAAKRSVKREHANFGGELSNNSAAALVYRLSANGPTPSSEVGQAEAFQRIVELLKRLDDRDREIILQRYLEQMSIQEIASSMDLPEATIRMRHLRALRKLKRILPTEDQL